MKLAFYKYEYGDWKDWLIAKLTRSKYSHIELVFEDELSLSSSPRDNGVRYKLIKYKPERWEFINLGMDTKEYYYRADDLTKFEHKYDWLSIILGWAGIKSFNRFNCVSACMYVLDSDCRYNTPQGVYEKYRKI